MKIRLFIIIFLSPWATVHTIGQNLVPNGSFEDYVQCPSRYTHFDGYVSNWFNSDSASMQAGSPDYLNACDTGIAGVPENVFGYQVAHTGLAYSGIALYGAGTAEFREYISVQLTSPLIKDSCYYFEMYCSLTEISKYTTDRVGVYFSDTAVMRKVFSSPQPFTPQIENPLNIVFDNANWRKVHGEYVANGGERYIIIGNYYYDSQTRITIAPNSVPPLVTGVSIFIDDVSLRPCPKACPTFAISTQTTLSQTASATGTVTISSTGGQYPYLFSLDNSLFQVDSIFTGLSAGTYHTYITDANGCTTLDSFTIEQCPEIYIEVQLQPATTNGSDGAATVTVSGGLAPYLYLLDTLLPTGDNNFVGLDTGTYHIYITDANGCAGSGSFSIGSMVSAAILDGEETLEIYPNPFTDLVFVRCGSLMSGVKIYDVSGKLVLSTMQSGVAETWIRTPLLQYGVYLLEVTTVSGNIYVRKLVK